MQSELPAISATGISKRYPGVVALDDVSVTIARGEVRAVLGKNGAGKSTLIRALTGAEIPDEGKVIIGGRELVAPAAQRTRQAAELGVRAVYQELSLVPDMTVAENLFLGSWPRTGIVVDGKAMNDRAAELIDRLRFPIDPRRTVASLEPAKRQLVEIARAMSGSPRLVILDEPTSSLSSEEVELLFAAVRAMADQGVAVLYVSHRMKEIRAVADTATILRDGRHIATRPIADTTTEEVVEMMLGATVEASAPIALAPPRAAVALSVRNLGLGTKVTDVSFDLHEGEVLGIAGLLGSGRTEILRAIAGLDEPDRGQMMRGGAVLRGSFQERLRAGISITPENRKDDGIFPLLGVDENVVLADPAKVSRRGILNASRIRAATATIVSRLSVKTADQSTPIGTLSGGNQQKLVIGRCIFAGADILLLDEPTRGVDVEAKAQIYALVRELAANGKSVIFVSSEAEELPLVCDRIVVLKEGRLTEEFSAPDIDTDDLMNAVIR
jgi:simple sugar transport system ATP-binding protein